MSTIDALKIIEACLTGVLMHTARRPHDREREHLIRSGNVFVYEESSSGIKRWTDGQNWSPSRILGNYLIYRELDKNFPPGDKKRAIKRKRDGKPELQNGHSSAPGAPTSLNDERERALLGSLIDSYPFKEGGLIKKTISIKWNNVMHHLVSYYSLEDARNHRLPFPNDDPKLVHLRPRPELIQLQDFRVPVEQEDPRFLDDRALLLGMLPHGSYTPTPSLERTMSLPVTNNLMPSPYGTNQYMGMPVHNTMSHSMPMGGHYGHPSNSYVTWEQQRPRAPSLTIPPFPTSVSHLMDNGSKRRRSDAYETGPETQDLFSPVAGHGHDVSRATHNYFHGGSSSYSISSHPASAISTGEPGEFKPTVTSMGPPSASSTAAEMPPSSASLAYAPAPLASANSSSSLDFPSSAASAAQPSVSMPSASSRADYSLTPTPSLTSSSLDGSSRGGDQFFAFNPPSWSAGAHDAGAAAGPYRPINGWHNAPPPGGHH